MDITEFWKFVKSMKLKSKTLTMAELDLIFLKANREDQSNTTTAEDNPDRELLPSEFVECLVRIADEKYPTVSHPSSTLSWSCLVLSGLVWAGPVWSGLV
jgi:hypothetical protein